MQNKKNELLVQEQPPRPVHTYGMIGAVVLLVVQIALCLFLLFLLQPPFASITFTLLFIWGVLSVISCVCIGKKLLPDEQDTEFLLPEEFAPVTESIRNDDFDLVLLTSLMNEGMLVLQEGNILFANKSFSYFVGAGNGELEGEDLSNYVYPDDFTILKNASQEVGATPPVRRTLRLNTRAGDIRWVVCNIHRINWKGELCNLLFFENIGPLKQAMLTLEEHELQQSVLIEKAPFGVALFDTVGQLITANSIWYSLWSNIVGVKAMNFNLLQDTLLPRKDLVAAVQQAFNKKGSELTSVEHPAPWGETRWLNFYFHPIVNAVGVQTGVLMVQKDITEQVRYSRRETELGEQLTALRRHISIAGEKFASFVDVARFPLIAFDKERTVMQWNDKAEQRFGIPRHKALGMRFDALGHAVDPYNDIVQRGILAGTNLYEESLVRHYEGRARHERLGMYYIDGGGDTLYILTIEDITEMVNRRQNHNLAHELAATANLAESIVTRLNPDNPKPSFLRYLATELTALTNLKMTPKQQDGVKTDVAQVLEDVLVGNLDTFVRPIINREYSANALVTVERDILVKTFDRLLNVLIMLSGSVKPELSLKFSQSGNALVVDLHSSSTILTETIRNEIFNPFATDTALTAIESVRFDLASVFMEIYNSSGFLEFYMEPKMYMVFSCRFPLCKDAG